MGESLVWKTSQESAFSPCGWWVQQADDQKPWGRREQLPPPRLPLPGQITLSRGGHGHPWKGRGKSLWHWNPSCTPTPLSSRWLTRLSYSLRKADCKELNCFHMSSARTEFVAFGNLRHPAAAATCVFLGRPPVHAYACVCKCVGACGTPAVPPPSGQNPSVRLRAGTGTGSQQPLSPLFSLWELTPNHVKQYTTEKNANKLRSA